MSKLIYVLDYSAIALLALALLGSLFCLIRFHNVYIRLITLEIVGNLLMAAICLWAFIHHYSVLIDVCLAVALIMFLSTVAYCQFLGYRTTKPKPDHKGKGERA